jgi:hypothetical protein
MHRATDTELYSKPPCLSMTTVSISGYCHLRRRGTFIATFEAQRRGPYRRLTTPSYQDLCSRVRLLSRSGWRKKGRHHHDGAKRRLELEDGHGFAPCHHCLGGYPQHRSRGSRCQAVPARTTIAGTAGSYGTTWNRNVREAVFPKVSAIDRVTLWLPVGSSTFSAERPSDVVTACSSSLLVMLMPSRP